MAVMAAMAAMGGGGQGIRSARDVCGKRLRLSLFPAHARPPRFAIRPHADIFLHTYDAALALNNSHQCRVHTRQASKGFPVPRPALCTCFVSALCHSYAY